MAYDGSLKFDTSIDTSGFSTGVSKLKGLASSFASAVGTAVTTAVAAVSAGVVAAVSAAVSVGSDFESAMSEVAAISGATDDELQKLSDKAKEMGSSTKYSATEAAEALKYMSLAGWTAEQSTEALDGVLNLAAASGMELSEASDMVTDYLSAFGMSAEESAYFADLLSYAQSNSNTTAEALGEAYKNCAANLNAAGQDVETVTSLLSSMANQGLKGSEAGTALAAIMRDITNEMQDGEIAIGDTSVAVADANGNYRDLTDILADVEKATDGMGTAEKAAALSSTFTSDSIKGLNLILNEGVDEAASFEEQLTESAGSAEKASASMNDNLQGDVTIMKSALEGLGIQVYETLDDGLREAVQLGTEYIDRLSKAFTDGGLEGAVAEAGEIFGELVTKIVDYAPDVVNAAVSFIKAFVKGISDNKDTVLSAVKEILNAVGSTLLELLPEAIQSPVAKTAESLQETLGNVSSAFTSAFTGEDIINAVSGIVGLITDLMNVILDMINDILPTFNDALSTIKDALSSSGFQKGIKSVKKLFENLSDVVGDLARTVLPVAAEIITIVAENLDILVPLAEGAALAFAAWKIINSVITWEKSLTAQLVKLTAGITAESAAQDIANMKTKGATTAMTLQQVAAALLTGEITLTTAATWLWNAAQTALNAVLEANPISIVVVAIAALATAVVGITNLIIQANDRTEEYNEAVEEMQEAIDNNTESSEELGSAVNNVSGYMDEFSEKIENAGSVLDDLNESVIMDTEKYDSLTQNMEDIQKEFTDIAGTYADERKSLTEEEISALEDLLQQMQDIADEQLELLSGYQKAASAKTEMFIEDFEGSAEEFAEASQSYINAANEARDKVIEAADEQYTNALTNIDLMTGLSEDEKQRLKDDAKENYDNAIAAAEKERDDTVAVIMDKYNQLDDAHVEFNEAITKLNDDLTQAELDHVARHGEIVREYADDQTELRIQLANEQTRYNNETAALMDEFVESFDEDAQKEIGIWAQMVAETQSSGGEIDEATALMVANMLSELRKLPDESQEAMQDTVDALEEIMDNLPDDMKEKANAAVDSFSDTLSSDSNKSSVEKAAKELMQSWYTALDKEIKTTASTGAQIGESFADGVAEGITSNDYKIQNAAAQAALSASTTTKSALQINSPSRLMRRIYGYFVDGCVVGIEENADSLVNAAEDLAVSAANSMEINPDLSVGLNTNSIGNKLAGGKIFIQLKSAVMSEASSIGRSAALQSTESLMGGSQSGKSVKASGNIEAHINIDGREFAVATVPYIDEELAFIRG